MKIHSTVHCACSRAHEEEHRGNPPAVLLPPRNRTHQEWTAERERERERESEREREREIVSH